MNPLKTILSKFSKNTPEMSHNYVGAESFATANPYDLFMRHYTSDAYSSAYPSIRAIANEYMTVRPFAIDANGKPVEHPVLDALYHPNQKDSSVAFAEKVAVSTLVLPNTRILVWSRNGNELRMGGDFGRGGERIAGFTFLEGYATEVREGVTHYNIGSQSFTDKEVITLPGGANPYSLYEGYSPMIAAKRWATLDDYIAEFQKGFFENNAIPAGHFIITAASKQDYEDTVNALKEKHRGAGNNNNVTYTPRPMDQAGNAGVAKIEWIPFQQSNKDIDFAALFEQANKRIDMAFGVSQFIKGVDDAPNYATAQVSEKNFAKRAVLPLLLRNYTQFTHELNRITGGMGIAINFDYEIPTVADEEKVGAETKNIEAALITSMVTQGYSLDSIVDAFELSNSYKLLKVESTAPVIDNDKPDVDEGDEVLDSPDPSKIDGVTPRSATKMALTDEQRMEKAAADYMQAQVDSAIANLPTEAQDAAAIAVKMQTVEEQELEAFVEAMLVVATGVMATTGADEYATAITLVEATGVDIASLQGFTLTDEAKDAYRVYIRTVGQSYGADTTAAIQKVLATADELGYNRNELEKALKNVLDTDEWRVKRLARTELNTSQNLGKLEGMKSMGAQTGLQFEKTLDHSGVTPCELCASQEGRWTAIEQPFWAYGQTIMGTEGTLFVNDWQDINAQDYHANGHGTTIFRVKE